MPLRLVKITEAIKKNILNNLSTVLKLCWLHNSRYNQLNMDFQALKD
jgi:hypothetical protein